MFNKSLINFSLKFSLIVLLILSFLLMLGTIGDSIDTMRFASTTYVMGYIFGIVLGITLFVAIMYSILGILYKINNKE